MLFKGKNIDDLTPKDMLDVIREMQKQEPDCEHWTFGEYVFVPSFVSQRIPVAGRYTRRVYHVIAFG